MIASFSFSSKESTKVFRPFSWKKKKKSIYFHLKNKRNQPEKRKKERKRVKPIIIFSSNFPGKNEYKIRPFPHFVNGSTTSYEVRYFISLHFLFILQFSFVIWFSLKYCLCSEWLLRSLEDEIMLRCSWFLVWFREVMEEDENFKIFLGFAHFSNSPGTHFTSFDSWSHRFYCCLSHSIQTGFFWSIWLNYQVGKGPISYQTQK